MDPSGAYQKRMTKSSSREVGCLEKDIISELPWNIQETILCFLPIEDAARTSILSKKWRHCWTMIPHLIFDNGFTYLILGEEVPDDDNIYEVMAYKFVSVINKILLHHEGPILKFSLYMPRDICNCGIIHDYIDQWIPLFSRKGLKQLVLVDYQLEDFRRHRFSSLDLTHLRLFIFYFDYKPAFTRFTHLTNLELVAVSCSFDGSIFDCPVLEKLTLIICTGLDHTNFRAPNLKCLLQAHHYITSESFVGLENLKEFSFVLGSPGFKSEQKMQTGTSDMVKVFGGLHTLEKFSVGRYFIEYLAAGGSPNRLPKPLPCLKTLNICDINFTDISEVSCLLCLIRSAPNLFKLNISGKKYLCRKGDLKDFWKEDSEDCTINHLQIITFSYFKGLRAELELVKFLLAHSPPLSIAKNNVNPPSSKHKK
ncbi:hypothetical protein AgCh_004135 [Apium graveolens]